VTVEPAGACDGQPTAMTPRLAMASWLLVAVGMQRTEHGLTTEAPPSHAAWARLLSWDSLRYQGSGWWLDRALPRSPGGLIAAAIALPALWFAIGLAITDDRAAYVATPDVKYQLWFFALHLITVRMTASLWARGLAPALGGLGVADDTARGVRRLAIGRWANLGALAAAAYFIARDTYMSFHAGPSGLSAFDDPDMWGFAALGHGVRVQMLVVWHLEWILFGYLLWLQLAAMLAITRAFRRTDFAPHLDRILVDDSYRDFFALSGKTATLALVFALGNLLFIHLTGELFPREVVHIGGVGDVLEQMSDLLSITVLFALIVVGGFANLIALRRHLTRALNEGLGEAGDRALAWIASGPRLGDLPGRETETARATFDAHAVLLRALVFQREIDALGGRAMRTVIAKAVPALTTAAKRVAKMHLGVP
jgi:hypothetical protein